MRLTHIKLAGFKSFVDPTTIPVPGDLVGIVGPNGCGKSNVIDAVRWVLGESKASALRGDSMQDVIFSGSANRKPVGRASVELIFDNKLGKAAGQWSSFVEISIKRIVQRDGDSVYYINNIRVRRRDITDIFLGTGVSGKGYAIIEQGMITRVIDAKPQELMVFLEEAAGVSRYRVRRHETELRLADTEKNLQRVHDISMELSKQLEHLEVQAEVATRFNALQEKLRLTQNLLWLACKLEAATQRIQAEKNICQLELELEAEITYLRTTEKKLEVMREQHYAASDAQHQIQGKLYTANAEITRLEQQQQHLRENANRLAQQQESVEKRQQQNNDQKNDAFANLQHWRDEVESAHLSYESIEQEEQLQRAKLLQIEADFRGHQEKLNTCQRNQLLIEQTLQLDENKYVHARKVIQNLQSRRERLVQEMGDLPQLDNTAIAELQLETENLHTDLRQKKAGLTQADSQLLMATKTREQAVQTLQALQQQLTQAESRFNALQQLQGQIDNNQALSAWFSKYQFDNLPRLWQAVQIKAGWENALEAILRERLNGTKFERLSVVEDWENDWPPGKWTLFESAKPSEPVIDDRENSGRRKDWASIQLYLSVLDPEIKPVLDEWLDKTYVVEDIRAGLMRRDQLSADERLITRAGHIFSRHSLTFYSPDSELHGVLARQQEITKLSTEISTLEQVVSKNRSQLEAAEQVCSEISEAITSYRHLSEQLQQQIHEVQLKLIKCSELNEHTANRSCKINEELSEIKQHLIAENEQQEQAQEKLADYTKQKGVSQKQLQQARLAWEAADELLVKERQSAQNILKQLQKANFHQVTCQNKVAENEQIIQLLEETTTQLAENMDHILAENCRIDVTNLGEQLQECLIQRKTLELAVVDARSAFEDAASELQKVEQIRLAVEQKLPPLRESISQQRLEEQEARLREQQFVEQLAEVVVNEAELVTLLGKKQAPTLQREIKQLNVQLAGLGAVNLAALDELNDLRTRRTYLETQSNDLKEAIMTLEKVIRQIDGETRLRLRETFNAVNSHLSAIFPELFGGGEAKLILSGDEILDSGAQLMAQPPGKKNNSLHLLSGGEKALTALALIFSLFRLNPAPFCLLDEVDAPLDDSNAKRFCDLVKKMSDQTQFLFISHNKITMEMAQQLIGVTMQEQGISRVVAVDIDVAISMNQAVTG